MRFRADSNRDVKRLRSVKVRIVSMSSSNRLLHPFRLYVCLIYRVSPTATPRHSKEFLQCLGVSWTTPPLLQRSARSSPFGYVARSALMLTTLIRSPALPSITSSWMPGILLRSSGMHFLVSGHCEIISCSRLRIG